MMNWLITLEQASEGEGFTLHELEIIFDLYPSDFTYNERDERMLVSVDFLTVYCRARRMTIKEDHYIKLTEKLTKGSITFASP